MSPGQFLVYAGAFILVIFAVVAVHESGHFLVGKLSGIRVDEFSIGFGPRLASRRRGETVYAVRLIPLGGFVRLAGMLGALGESDAGERNFYRASIPKRLMTIAAGVVFNFVFAVACFTAVNMAQPGRPWVIAQDGPAQQAGIPQGAVVTHVGDKAIRDDNLESVATDLHAAMASSQGRPVSVTYRTGAGTTGMALAKPQLAILNPSAAGVPAGEVIVTAINGRDPGTGDPEHLLGRGAQVRVSGYVITPQQRPGRRFTDAAIGGVRDLDDATRDSPAALWVLGVQAGYPGQAFPTALAHGVTAIPTFIHDTAAGIYRLITVPSAGGITGPQGLSGPVGIAVATATVSQNGFLAPNGLLWWIGFISMNLGLINVLPIPFLDGGKLLFLGVESIRRKRVDPRFEAVASAVGLAVVALLVIYVTIGDVGRLL